MLIYHQSDPNYHIQLILIIHGLLMFKFLLIMHTHRDFPVIRRHMLSGGKSELPMGTFLAEAEEGRQHCLISAVTVQTSSMVSLVSPFSVILLVTLLLKGGPKHRSAGQCS